MKQSNRPFKEELQALLDERDWSQRELERRLRAEFGMKGTAHTSIRLWLLGELHPTRAAMERVAKVMRLDPEHFAEVRLERVRDAMNWREVGTGAALRALDRLRG